MWTEWPNYVIAHNPGSGTNFLKLKINDLVLINGKAYRVVDSKRLWGPKSIYANAPADKEYHDTTTDAYEGDWLFDGRMTLQTCADETYSDVVVLKCEPVN
jgi:hypothetical protein